MEQPGWRWCSKCYGLFYSGNPSQGSCPVDRGAHDGATSGAYSVDLDAPHEGGQSAWRWCAKCQGLFFGGNPSQGRCAADGAAHDGGGNGDYTLDSEGPTAPTGAQSGWRWCSQCQGLFFAGGSTLGTCPSGGPHVAEGSGAYVVKHQPVAQVQTALAEVKLAMPKVAFMMMKSIQTPVFLRAQSNKLEAGPTVSISATDGKAWCGLAGWLDQPAHAADAIVQCRRTGLTVQLDAKADPAVELLPLDDASPQAALVYTDEGQTKREPLQAILDVQKRSLKLVREFSPAEGELFGRIMSGISSPSPATVEVSYTHRYRVQQPVPRDPRPWPRPVPAEEMAVEREVRDHRTQVEREVRDHRTMPARVVNPMVNPALRVNLNAVRANQPQEPAPEPQPRAAAAPTAAAFAWRTPSAWQNQQAWTAWMKAHPNALKDWRVYRPDYRRFPVEDDPPDPEERITPATFTHQFSIGVNRPISDEAAFPDHPRHEMRGWGQVPGRTGKAALHFCTSGRADVFFFLPTAFKLGYYVEPGGDGAGSPPMRARLYLDGTGQYRVEVTLVALPFIDDADREALRSHLREVVLRRNPPYVGLELKAGLQAKLVPDYTAGSPADGQQLPTSIRFEAKEERPNDRLELGFDMAAADYAIFCELLRRGLTGRVQVSEPDGVQESIPVRLRLDDITTNSMVIEGGADDEPVPGEAPDAAPQAAGITLRNVLGEPVRLSSLRVHLVDRGALVGMVVDAEEVALLPEGQDLGPSGDAAASSVTLPFPRPTHVAAVDEAVVVPGAISVRGRSPDDWLNQVNREGALQEQSFRVSVQLSVPAAGAGRIQLVNLQVLKEGDPTPPQPERQVLPSDAATELAVRRTLADLMGSSGQPATYALEYDCVYSDGSLSLSQRVALDPDVRSVVLPILVETPTSRYTVRYEGRQEEHDRAGAVALVNRLRSEGKRWNVYATQPPA
jgi:hypothetical protein